MKYDVVVIGGGPSGLMAAITASEHGAKTMLIDKGSKLGRKLAISGGGRCNVTNRLPEDELIKHIPGNGRFLYSAFSIFNNEGIIAYFEKLGVQLKEEDKGRMFPISNSAKQVVQTLLNQLDRLNVTVKTNTPVEAIHYQDDVHDIILKTGEKISTKAVIVAVGGKSVPQTGSTGDGYAWAKKAGHTITDLYPTEVPLTSKEPFIQDRTLQGLSLRDIGITVHNPKGKAIKTHRWDIIFTHQGISGPAALRLSQYVVKALKKFKTNEVTVTIDSFPDQNEEETFQMLMKLSKESPKKAVKTVWKGIVPERFLHFLLSQTEIKLDQTYDHLVKNEVRKLAKLLKSFPVQVNGTLSIEKAFITGGGVSLKEIIPNEMASKKMHGLYFCGEILDIHGYTGGFNITAAFSTGHVAGRSAAEYVKYI
ncbi:BaiN/RdsA family NAD(P)/FAD-dependent oxidoreductase [Salinibacillus xinjiangensis]|uniref:Aminoacetone oxidase family FAD-binding enzyme n=1 Tax=Salinibacillus xinjiangensis TaxID=1229268 RepID=A0A6G1XA22_9BACI|nr:NAD(P)/FAD-dependent oxidoreductase [Salinibacillus xinjiangensis]MRG87755.1 aminoacetone oxidase family FAD-binding enzyme [Salinibacillus xinjiangensis]